MLARRTAAAALAALGLVVGACGSSSPAQPAGAPPGTGPGSATGIALPPAPTEDAAMTATRGPIYPADQLLAWLEGHRSDPATLDEVPLRLPVLVTLTANKMDVDTATVGDKPGALAIRIDDRTLAVPIAGKLGMFFGEGAATGMLWLHGLWRGGPNKQFQVTRVEDAVEKPATATHAERVP